MKQVAGLSRKEILLTFNRLFSKPHLVVKIAIFGIFIAKFFNHILLPVESRIIYGRFCYFISLAVENLFFAKGAIAIGFSGLACVRIDQAGDIALEVVLFTDCFEHPKKSSLPMMDSFSQLGGTR